MRVAAIFSFAVVALSAAPRVAAECVERGVWHKEVYCTGGGNTQAQTQYVYVPPVPSTEQQAEALLAEARRLIQANELMAARLQVEAALRLRPGDANALALHSLLSRLFAEAQARAERERLEQRIRTALLVVGELETMGRLDEAQAKAEEAARLNPADPRAWDARERIRGKILEERRARRAAQAAAAQADYQRALALAREHSTRKLRELAGRMDSLSWRQMRLAAHAGSSAQETIAQPREDTTEEEQANAVLRIPFDTNRIAGLMSAGALPLPGNVPGKPVAAPKTDGERILVLIEQIDYLEGVQRDLELKLTRSVDPVERRILVAQSDLVRGVKATARAKLINLSVSRPK